MHAGDIGADPDVLWELEAIAPVTAVLGNCDYALPGFELAGLARTTVAGVRILAIHDFADLGPMPARRRRRRARAQPHSRACRRTATCSS